MRPTFQGKEGREREKVRERKWRLGEGVDIAWPDL